MVRFYLFTVIFFVPLALNGTFTTRRGLTHFDFRSCVLLPFSPVLRVMSFDGMKT